jgi:hypothetical protein
VAIGCLQHTGVIPELFQDIAQRAANQNVIVDHEDFHRALIRVGNNVK